MDQVYVQFFIDHWVLIVCFSGTAGVLAFDLSGGFVRGSKAVSVIEAVRLINRENAVVVDLRADANYRKVHVVDAISLPLKQFPDRLRELNKFKDRPIILYCEYGGESSKAGGQLAKAGFATVYRLRGGFIAWQNEKLPIQ
jgi:rhodanese-related sulfurtransferase